VCSSDLVPQEETGEPPFLDCAKEEIDANRHTTINTHFSFIGTAFQLLGLLVPAGKY
jgi:hypothetical protein